MPKGVYIRKPFSEEYRKNISKALLGRRHSDETKQKISKAHLGKTFSDTHRKNLSKTHIGKTLSEETRNKISANSPRLSGTNHPMWSKHHSEDAKRRMSETQLGTRSFNYGKSRSDEVRKKLSLANTGKTHSEETRHKIGLAQLGRKRTPETRRKQRISALAYKELYGNVCPRIGKNEKALLDKQERLDGVPILRQCHLHTLGYYVDGYCVETNTIYDVYEKRHLEPKVMRRDIIRQQEIQSLLGCKFVIIWDRSH